MQGEARNTGGPSALPSSRQGASYKPKAKSSAAQRESEGIEVLSMTVKNNAVGGKGPCGDLVGRTGKRESMTAKSGSNNSGGRPSVDKVRELQRRLWSAAKQNRKRRFHALMDRIWRSDVLQEAWKRVKANRGTAGVDRQTLADVEQHGVELFLKELGEELRAGTYRPSAVRRRYIPKPDGKQRPLGIPTIKDRVAQMAAKLVLEPIFEADFLPCSYGYRPKRSATMALETLRKLSAKGFNYVLDADIRDYFGSIDHDKLMKLVEQRISDRRVLKLLRQWLKAGVLENGAINETITGTPQGGVISPLLSNIFLHVLDRLWTRHSAPLGELVRYCDDFVVVSKTRGDSAQAEKRVRAILERLGLELHPEKTKRIDLGWGQQGFDFLGCHLRKRLSGEIWEKKRRRLYFLHRWPSLRSMKRIRSKVKALTPSGRCHADLREVISDLNPLLKGWEAYFRTGNASRRFNQLDSYVWQRLKNLRFTRAGRNLRAGQAEKWTREYFHNLGLHRLRGHVQYPEMRNAVL